MAVYGVGDVQGCYDELCRLLDELRFDPASDRLLFTGDLVNRGPHSLAVLQLVRSLGDRATVVLGNHDLHLLALAAGAGRNKRSDTLKEILESSRRDELLDWLRHRPLAYQDPETGYLLVHAGLPPQWNVHQALAYAREVQTILDGPERGDFYQHMYGDQPCRWDGSLTGWPRLRFITNALTRLRYCYENGDVDFSQKGAPEQVKRPLLPWFRLGNRRSVGEPIVFGHWSTLGYLRENGVLCLDGGCLWGGKLVAARLDDPAATPVMVSCEAKQAIGTP